MATPDNWECANSMADWITSYLEHIQEAIDRLGGAIPWVGSRRDHAALAAFGALVSHAAGHSIGGHIPTEQQEAIAQRAWWLAYAFENAAPRGKQSDSPASAPAADPAVTRNRADDIIDLERKAPGS